jgi:metal-sulfur cluster biosynthetic enzyme
MEVTMADELTAEAVLETLKTVYDPEIPVNVVDLGLIYDVQVKEKDVYVQMTLTFPGCGMGPFIAQQAEWAIQDLEGVEEVEIELVFDPPWSPDLISEEARSQLGI